jgi:hypothetical protein
LIVGMLLALSLGYAIGLLTSSWWVVPAAFAVTVVLGLAVMVATLKWTDTKGEYEKAR